MDQGAFSVNNYQVKLHKSADELLIEVVDSKTEKVYKHKATNQTIKDLNLFFLNDINDLNEILTEGLSDSNPNTRVRIGSGPCLELETTMKFGKIDKTSTTPFKLEEDQDLSAIATCERLVNNLIETGSKNASPIESQIIKILQKLVDFGKNVEDNMVSGSKDSEQKVNKDKQGANDEVKERLNDLEKNIKHIESCMDELRIKESRPDSLELRFDEINHKLSEHTALLSRSTKSADDSETQTKIRELENTIKEIEERVQRHGSGSSSQLQKLVGDVQKMNEQAFKFESLSKSIESLQNVFSPEEKSGAPYPLVPLKEIVQSESFIINNYEIELFKTSKEFVIQAEDLATSKIYMRTISDNNVRGVTVNSYTNITNFYEGLATLLREKPDDSIITLNEGKISFTRPKKFNLSLEKIELDPFASCERTVRRFTEKTVEPRFLLENRLKEMFRKIFDQEKKLTNIVFETVLKFEQLEKTVEELQS